MILILLFLFLPTPATRRGIYRPRVFSSLSHQTRRRHSNTAQITPSTHTIAPKTNTHTHIYTLTPIDTVPVTAPPSCMQRLSSSTSLLNLYHLYTSFLEPPTTILRVCTSLSSHCTRVATSPLTLTLTLRRHTSVEARQPPSRRRTYHKLWSCPALLFPHLHLPHSDSKSHYSTCSLKDWLSTHRFSRKAYAWTPSGDL